MVRPVSLTLRLTLLFGAVATMVLLTFGWIIERSIKEHFVVQDTRELKEVVQVVEQSLSTLPPSHDLEQTKQRLDAMLAGQHSAILLILDTKGQRLYATPGPDLALVLKVNGLPLSVDIPRRGIPAQGIVQNWISNKQSYRVYIQQVTGKNNTLYTIIAAVPIDFHLHFLTHFHYILWLMVAASIIVMGGMGWVVVRQGHKPLHRIVDQIRRISANELNTRLIPEAVPAELSDLAMSFNELLQRMEEAFNRLSNFSADIAHELRTPVTNLMTQTQVALSQARDISEYKEILYSNMEEYERMAQMIGDMLFLAKADNGLCPPNTEVIDLKHEIDNLFDYYSAWAEESRITLIQEGDASIQGDRLMLRRVLSNLLSNAIRHTPADNQITVKLDDIDGNVLITVENPGIPISAEHLTKVFDRFYRTDPSRQRSGEGAGLGLAIVKSIVEAHGGTIVANSDEMSTEFRITLPGIVKNPHQDNSA